LIRCLFVDTQNIDRPSIDVFAAYFPPSSNFIRLRPHPLIRCTFVDTKNIDRPSLDVPITRFPSSSNFIRLSPHPLIRFAEGNPLSASASHLHQPSSG
jgi:hypothetical protein